MNNTNLPGSEAVFRSKHCGDIPKLNSTNYLQWSSSMTDHFGACDNIDIVFGARPCPPANRTADVRAWKIQDSQARGAIKGACTNAMRTHIEQTRTSAEMWTILAGHANSASSVKGRTLLTNQFRAATPILGEPLSNYVGKLSEIRDQLSGTTHEISDWMFQQQLLHNLPPAYATIRDIIENKDPPPTTQEIIDILKRKELDLLSAVTSNSTATVSGNALSSLGSPSAFRHHNLKNGRFQRASLGGNRNSGRGSNFRKSPYTMNCYNCGKSGHRAAECSLRACFSCGESTHLSSKCPYTTLTQDQARNGRTAFQRWSSQRDHRNDASANLSATDTEVNETITSEQSAF